MGIAGDYIVHDVMKIEELPDGSVLVHCLSVEPSSGSDSVEFYPTIVNPELGVPRDVPYGSRWRATCDGQASDAEGQ